MFTKFYKCGRFNKKEVIKMGVIAIRFDDEDERKLKAIATTQGKKISEYCRELILNKKIIKPENYTIIENELEQIKNNLKTLNDYILQKQFENMIYEQEFYRQRGIVPDEEEIKF